MEESSVTIPPTLEKIGTFRKRASKQVGVPTEEKKGRKCSPLTKVLLLLLALMLVACLVLVNLYIIERQENEELQSAVTEVAEESTQAVKTAKNEKAFDRTCYAKECYRAAIDLLNSIDPTVNPCEDFYGYACGGWLKRNPLPAGKQRWSTFTKLEEENNKLIQEVIGSKEIRARYSREEAVLKALAFYDSCMDTERINKLKGEPLKDLLERFGSWAILDSEWDESSWDFVSQMVELQRNLTLSTFISLFVDLDLKNSSQNVLVVDEGRPGLSPGAFLRNTSDYRQMRVAYRELITNLSLLLGARKSPQFEKDISDIINIEGELAKIVTPPPVKFDLNAMYNKLSIQQLSEKAGKHIDWMRYFGGLFAQTPHKITEDLQIVVFGLDYMVKLDELLGRTPKRVLANYIMWRLVKSKYIFLGEAFEEVFKAYYIKAYGNWADTPRPDLCLFSTGQAFGLPISKLYLDMKFFGKSKELANEIIDNIKEFFIRDLKKNVWMDDETKQSAKDKAEALLENIGYPDEINQEEYLNDLYSNVKIDPKSYFENELYLAKKEILDGLGKFNKPVDNSKWTIPPTMLNAFYSYSENKMVFPAAMLQPPFYNVGYPRMINYGGIGGIMGHELTHGFDDEGKRYDKHGDLKEWWTDWTLGNFGNRSKCLVDQYSEKSFFGLPLNGQNTLSENIADNGGVKQAFQAYRTWVERNWEEPRLPGPMLSNEQVFFISFARNWCGHSTEMAAHMAVAWDDHSPSPWRVNMTLQNFPEFARVYNCPVGSPMNPKKRCSVW